VVPAHNASQTPERSAIAAEVAALDVAEIADRLKDTCSYYGLPGRGLFIHSFFFWSLFLFYVLCRLSLSLSVLFHLISSHLISPSLALQPVEFLNEVTKFFEELKEAMTLSGDQ
jgi:hypothetical protein